MNGSVRAGTRLAVAACLFVGVAVACSPDPWVSENEIDFVGILVNAEVSQWVSEPAGGSIGGPESFHLVGPGTLTLSSGQEIWVPPGTPGGTFCRDLKGENANGPACLIVGEFAPGSDRTVSWFATPGSYISSEEPLEFQLGRISGVRGLEVLVSFPGGRMRLPVSDDLRFDCFGEGEFDGTEIDLPRAAIHFANVNTELEVVEIACAYGD